MSDESLCVNGCGCKRDRKKEGKDSTTDEAMTLSSKTGFLYGGFDLCMASVKQAIKNSLRTRSDAFFSYLSKIGIRGCEKEETC